MRVGSERYTTDANGDLTIDAAEPVSVFLSKSWFLPTTARNLAPGTATEVTLLYLREDLSLGEAEQEAPNDGDGRRR